METLHWKNYLSPTKTKLVYPLYGSGQKNWCCWCWFHWCYWRQSVSGVQYAKSLSIEYFIDINILQNSLIDIDIFKKLSHLRNYKSLTFWFTDWLTWTLLQQVGTSRYQVGTSGKGISFSFMASNKIMQTWEVSQMSQIQIQIRTCHTKDCKNGE